MSADESSFAKFRIKTDYVELADCTVEPSARDELLTLFKIDCRDFTSGTLYQLFQVYEIYGDEHLVLLATETVPYFEVYLGSGAIFLHIYKHTGYFDNIEIPVITTFKVTHILSVLSSVLTYAINNLLISPARLKKIS